MDLEVVARAEGGDVVAQLRGVDGVEQMHDRVRSLAGATGRPRIQVLSGSV
jgi:hypothetical protein